MTGGIIRLLERKTTLSDNEKQYIMRAIKLQWLVEAQIDIENKFIWAPSKNIKDLKGLYSAEVRRGILQKLWDESHGE